MINDQKIKGQGDNALSTSTVGITKSMPLLSQDQQRTEFLWLPADQPLLNYILVMPYAFTKGQYKKQPVTYCCIYYMDIKVTLYRAFFVRTYGRNSSLVLLPTKNRCASP